MGKFYGMIGYGITKETVPGVWVDTVIEKEAYGDILKNSRQMDSSDKVNSDISINNRISIVADPYIQENFQFIKYVKFLGISWRVSSVEVEYPRLILTLGGVYNGQQA